MKNQRTTTTTATQLKNSSGDHVPGDPNESQLADEARRIDEARARQDASNPVDETIRAETAPDPPPPPPPPEPKADPMLVTSLTMLVSSGVLAMHAKYDWTVPGDEWKSNVATLAALIIDRYIPLLMKGQTDVLALLLLIGPYVLENLVRTAGRSDSDLGSTGQRKNDFIEPAPSGTVAHFPSSS